VYMLLLINRPRLMGIYKNRPWQNWVAGATAAVMIGLTAAFIWTNVVG